MNMPDPAQPALPALPQQLSGLGAGGYTIPQQQAPNTTPINGAGPTFQPSPQNVYSPPQSLQAPPQAGSLPQTGTPQTGAQTPPQGDMTDILKQLQNSPDPKLFAQQFNMLMQQRDTLAGPQGVDSHGSQIPSKDQEKYIKGEMDRQATFLTQPKAYGGQGMTAYQARVQVANETKQKYPNLDPRYITLWAAGAGPGDPTAGPGPDEAKKVSLGENQPSVEFGPSRVAKITPDKIAEILLRPEFQTAQKLVDEYKQTAPSTPTAKDFAKFAIDRQFSGMLAKTQKAQDALDAARNSYNILEASIKARDPQTLKALLEKGLTSKQALGQAQLAVAEAQQNLSKLPFHGQGATAKARQAAQDFFAKEAHVFSVAAALNNIY